MPVCDCYLSAIKGRVPRLQVGLFTFNLFILCVMISNGLSLGAFQKIEMTSEQAETNTSRGPRISLAVSDSMIKKLIAQAAKTIQNKRLRNLLVVAIKEPSFCNDRTTAGQGAR